MLRQVAVGAQVVGLFPQDEAWRALSIPSPQAARSVRLHSSRAACSMLLLLLLLLRPWCGEVVG